MQVRFLARLFVAPATAEHICKAIAPLEKDGAAGPRNRDLLSLAAAVEPESSRKSLTTPQYYSWKLEHEVSRFL